MDSLIYTVMSGADSALHTMRIRANNLANVQTDGFRADLEMSSNREVAGYGYSARHVAVLEPSVIDGSSGKVLATGGALDAAIKGQGYFTVAWEGGEAYTRSGSFNIDSEGVLTVGGLPVLGEGGTIVLPPFDSVEIGEDGTISILPQGANEMQQVDGLKLVRPEAGELMKNEAGLLVSQSGQPLPPDDTVVVLSRHLESSNVSAIEEMVQTMSLSRNFEIQMRLLKAADEMADTGNRLIRS